MILTVRHGLNFWQWHDDLAPPDTRAGNRHDGRPIFKISPIPTPTWRARHRLYWGAVRATVVGVGRATNWRRRRWQRHNRRLCRRHFGASGWRLTRACELRRVGLPDRIETLPARAADANCRGWTLTAHPVRSPFNVQGFRNRGQPADLFEIRILGRSCRRRRPVINPRPWPRSDRRVALRKSLGATLS